MNNKPLVLILILSIALLFRFYNFHKFQYWSGDEEIAAAVVRRMVHDEKLTFVSPNVAVNILGSFFHILSVPIFIISNFDPIKVELIVSFLGVITAFIVYKAGELLLNSKTGVAASLLYSGSFVIALFDRRWWPLSLNPLLTSLAIISLFKIISQRNYKYSMLLAASVGFAFHADPTIAVIAVAATMSFVFLRVPIRRKEYLGAFLVVVFFILPLFAFELRHPGKVTKPFGETVNKITQKEKVEYKVPFINPLPTFSRLYFSKPTDFAERHFCYCPTEGLTYFPLASNLVIGILFAYPLYLMLLKTKNRFGEKKLVLILYFFLLAFILGGSIYTLSFGKEIYDHYYTIIFPVTSLILGYSLVKLVRSKLLFVILLVLFLGINFYTLGTSSFKYPLSEKKEIVEYVVEELGTSDFSLYAIGGPYMHGGGFTSLFILADKSPKKSYIYPFYDWMYRAFSLYTVDPQTIDQEKIVLIGSESNFPKTIENLQYEKSVNNLKAVILNNDNSQFDEKTLSTSGVD